MSYYTAVSGEILIEPPLRGATLKASPFYDPWIGGEAQRCIRLDAGEEPADGAAPETATELVARRVISADVERLDAFDMEDELQELLDAFPGHTFTGRLQCMGDNHWSDMWGVVVRDGRAEKVTPTVVWPGDTET
ncbi:MULTISPECIES: DUF6205 family protein [unclassified Streptomyces]|uniref:DUF6205 family protein n=1 Tax=unclassified Streptomyces TaxID=2593676 RepID=UPI00081F1CE2|nr:MULTISPECIES: DUF6205 family protein [unclassified Streptomyces]MYZ37917.1 hypothetical protein [Streptomyces sp. SID4917]SCF95154.1 hypothetical protein GA0115259_105475 [Streptomyces sp. MnatMP-M17]